MFPSRQMQLIQYLQDHFNLLILTLSFFSGKVALAVQMLLPDFCKPYPYQPQDGDAPTLASRWRLLMHHVGGY